VYSQLGPTLGLLMALCVVLLWQPGKQRPSRAAFPSDTLPVALEFVSPGVDLRVTRFVKDAVPEWLKHLTVLVAPECGHSPEEVDTYWSAVARLFMRHAATELAQLKGTCADTARIYFTTDELAQMVKYRKSRAGRAKAARAEVMDFGLREAEEYLKLDKSETNAKLRQRLQDYQAERERIVEAAAIWMSRKLNELFPEDVPSEYNNWLLKLEKIDPAEFEQIAAVLRPCTRSLKPEIR